MTSLELPPELKSGLDAVKERDGIPQSEQIRRAIRAWLEGKGIEIEVPRKVGAKQKTRSRR
jgi:predicted DNA-binding protein